MTKEQAIVHLKLLKFFDCPLFLEEKRMSIAVIQEQEQRRWIPVTERLPDKPMKCLVYTKRGECCGYDMACYNQGFYLQYANVTHWMPLPEPPKEP